MARLLVDDAPKDIKYMRTTIETDPWLELGLQKLEPHAGSTPTRFKRREFEELIARIESEAQSEHESWVNNYRSYSGVTANARILSHDNDAAVSAGIAVSGTVVIGGGDTFGGGIVESGFAYQPRFRVVARIEKPKFLPSALEQRLEEFKQLTEGWDSYGSLQISHTAVEGTKAVITQALSDEIGLPAPFVAPTSPGGIGLEWKLESGKELLLEISPTGDMSYLLVEPRLDGGEDEVEDYISDPEELKNLLLALSE